MARDASDRNDSASSKKSVRDRLALERTGLANERTLLAYIRTALALAGAGAALVQFVDTRSAAVAGWSLVAAGGVALGLGLWRFRATARKLRRGV